MKKVNFIPFSLTANELKTIKGGDGFQPVVMTTNQINDFNSSRSNRQKGN